MQFEYTAIPAPFRSEKAKEAKTAGDRYALTLTTELNRMAADGWEYIRADVLPSEERSGLTGRSTVYHNLLIFRRAVADQGGQVVKRDSKLAAVANTPAPASSNSVTPVTGTTEGKP